MIPNKRELLKNIEVTDRFIRENYPLEQTYIYTPKGDPVVFTRKVGFDPETATITARTVRHNDPS